jgi:surface carbohydrate biosynthesis protein
MNYTQKSAALLVHLPLRDLTALVLTAIELTRRGVISYLIPVSSMNDVWSLRPHFVLLPHLRPSLDDFVRSLLRAGIQYGVLDTEGGVIADFDEYDRTLTRDVDVKKNLSRMLMWSPRLTSHLIEEGHFTPDQLCVTGCPRMDLYCSPWSQITADSSERLEGSRPLILINTNIPLANPDVPVESLFFTRVKHYGYTREQVVEWREIQLKALDHFVELASQLAEDFPQCDVVIRPHPHEPALTYVNRIRSRSNLEVEKVGSVHSWINRAVAVIQSNCTTAIESGAAGKPTLCPAWIPVSWKYPMTEEVSDLIPDYDSLRLTVGKILSGTYQVPNAAMVHLQQTLRDWFGPVDGQCSSRVADQIAVCVANGGTPDRDAARLCMYGLRDPWPRDKAQVGSWMKYKLGLPAQFSLRSLQMMAGPNGNRERYFEAEEVEQIVSAYWRLSGSKPQTSVSAVPQQIDGVVHINHAFRLEHRSHAYENKVSA